MSLTQEQRSASPVFSSVSLKSDNSKGIGPNFSEKTPSDIKSERWQETLINIGSEITRWKTLKEQRGIKSDEELTTFLLDRIQFETSAADLHYFEDDISRIFQGLENKIAVFFKNELERLKKILTNENTQYYVKDFKENKNNIREAALDVTIHFLRSMKQDELADTLEDELIYTCQLKSDLEKKYQCVFEGIAKQGDSTLLNKIYTDLYITQGGGEQVNTEHEIRQIEVAYRHLESPDIQINFKDLFKPHEQTQTIRTVLTKGVAGIGKSVSVQKFVLDWAEGKENQDISFIFPLPFREMNLKEKAEVSLKDLLCEFFPEIKGLDLTRKNKKVLFIFDGLDECRLPLKFDGNEIWSDITSPAPLDVLLTNLIKGNLLPHAHIWITTRPAAAGKIPPECIDRVTEVRGFNDEQKEEYFRKRFTDQNMADTIIDHVKKSKSLFIMCHIPVFCWISATVLQNILEKKSKDQTDDTQESNTDDTPRTLTQMYTHFFHFQIQQSRRKYDGEYSPDISWDMDSIYSLGKLAFEQLQKNNLIFYESDLEECGIDVSKASVYSGMCTQIFKQETGIILGTVYCFIHLSIQEFIAALYAHLFLDKNKKNVFVQEHMEPEAQNETLTGLLKTAVDKALESDNGHLDLFLRFLLGLSLESNRPLLQGLLSQEESNKQNNTEIVEYIKQKFEDSLCPERSINLFYCLNELNDQTLVQEIQKHLSEGSLSSSDLSPAQWSALAFVLLTSDEELMEFELQKFKKSDECLIRLLAVVKSSKHALLHDCNLTDKSCSALAEVLSSDNSLEELNMSNNNLQDSGVKLLCAGLKNIKCELKKLSVSKCDLTEESCSALAAVLSSDSSSLKDLDMSRNNLQDDGVKRLSEGLKNTNCELNKLSLSKCSIGEEGYKCLCSAVRSNPESHLIELDLRGNDPGETGVKLIYQLIQDHKCKLNTVRFLSSSSAVKAFEFLTETLGINPLLQREVNLSDHKLDESRVNQICDLLKDKHCHINTLMLGACGLTEEGLVALTSALNSNPSHLRKLDLSLNPLRDSGVEHLCALLSNSQFRLKTLDLYGCSIKRTQRNKMISALCSNPSHLRELNLNGNKIKNTGVKLLCRLLKHSQCKLEKLNLYWCNITDVTALTDTLAQTRALRFLKELDLSYNNIKEQKRLHEVLKSSNCELRLQTFPLPLFLKPRGVQSSSDEEDGDTSSQNVKPKDQAEGGQSTDRETEVS
ncbi:NLR family CARD domain-containing protein 3 CARD15-like protein [Triplophysa tibetana]|uniref:NLR family CARD domain-containing protein 3 CARD15-like protein n=1 Tax=Triplophysa tibetana TaxID=1572043 RepID=A0A5A9NQS2_9TELE|nr:NLR family CARD domain-containing protein 3 CARD15-like protein [Triplophysa tibetana]